MNLNYCDYGHTTTEEVRRLPIGVNMSMFVCEKHYWEQLEHWQDQGFEIQDVPPFQELKEYNGE